MNRRAASEPHTNPRPGQHLTAFSLVELVIVIVIIGIIAAIAVPRFGKATEQAAANADNASLSILQNAVDLFIAEHPNATLSAGMIDESNTGGSVLTNKTKADGTVDNNTGLYGPYLRSIPARQTGPHANSSGVADVADGNAAWLFDAGDATIDFGDCLDNDGDGYGQGDGCLGPDCNDADDTINAGC